MELPEALRRFRKEFKLTQKDAASFLGIKDRTYQNYEYGKLEPSISGLIALALHFGTSLDYLCGLSDDPARK